jgi:hypothetical protein
MLPGDFHFNVGGVTIFFPIVTCILLSLVLSFLFNVFAHR